MTTPARAVLGVLVLLGIVAALLVLSGPFGEAATRAGVSGDEPSSGERVAPSEVRPVAPEELREVHVAGSAAPPAEAVTRTGRVEGLLVTELGEPVGAGALRLSSSDATIGPVLVDEEGRFAFEGVDPGEYLVLVDEESLPPGLVGPWRQDKPSQWDDTPPGYYGTVARVEAAATASVVVTVHVGATLSGRVVTLDGQTGEGIWVAAVRSGAPRLGGLRHEARTDAEGYWEMTVVTSGHHHLQIGSLPGLEHLGRPVPETFFVPPGASLWLGTEVLGAGPMTVRGTVVDQDGEPFVDMNVQAYFHRDEADVLPHESRFGWFDIAAWTDTDAEGRYEFTGLARATIRIRVETRFRFGASIGENILVRFAPQLAVDLRRVPRANMSWPEVKPHGMERPAPDVVVLAPLIAERSRPYIVEGRVILDESWASAHDATPRSLSLYAVYPQADKDEEKVKLSKKDGTFRWGCETPQEPVTLVLEGRRDPDLITPQRVVIFPRASETEDITFHVP